MSVSVEVLLLLCTVMCLTEKNPNLANPVFALWRHKNTRPLSTTVFIAVKKSQNIKYNVKNSTFILNWRKTNFGKDTKKEADRQRD